MLKRSKKILLEGTLAEFKNYPRGAEGREYVLMNIEEKEPDGSYAFYEKDEKGDIISVSYKGAEGYDAAEFILFKDPEFERVMLVNFDTNNSGVLVRKEISGLVDFGDIFHNNTDLVSLEDLKLFKNVRIAGAFLGCTSLRYIYIPQGTSLYILSPSDLLSNPVSLEFDESIKDSDIIQFVKSIGNQGDIENIILHNQNLKITETLHNKYILSSDGKKLYLLFKYTDNSTIEIPETVNLIQAGAFKLSHIEDLIINNNIQTIEAGTFSNCTSLEHIYWNSSLPLYNINDYSTYDPAYKRYPNLISITIGKYGDIVPDSLAWLHGENLLTIEVDSENTKFDSRLNCNAIIEKSTNTLILGCANTIIPNTVLKLKRGSFDNVTFPSDYNLIIPSSVEEIGEVTATGYGYGAFNTTVNILSVTVLNETPPLCLDKEFGNNFSRMLLYVPISGLSNYLTTSPWNKFKTITGY